MAESPAYQKLTPEQKQNIEDHIRLNNKPVLLYVYQQLREEADSLQFSREKLAKKALTIKPSDLSDLQTAVQKNFSKGPRL